MTDAAHEPMVIVASAAELPEEERVWGTGGWKRPEAREALDWLTLSRLLGWGVRVLRPEKPADATRIPSGARWIIVACDPDSLSADFVSRLNSALTTNPMLVVARAAAAGEAFARLAGVARADGEVAGRSLCWTGPGAARDWHCRETMAASALSVSSGTSVWATLDGAPCIAARAVGRGVIATPGFHPSHARDTAGAATALLKHLLMCGSPAPVACLDFENTLVLRMDDPGGAQNIYSRSWSYPKLGESQWTAVGADLKQRNARLSIGYVAGWVDDGDSARGELLVAGQTPSRVPGTIYDSPAVQYRDLAGHLVGVRHDYTSEFRGIQALRAAGLADVELHGFTHMHLDCGAWAKAPDRYERTAWFRELGGGAEAAIAALPRAEHPVTRGISAMRRLFETYPTTLIPPGDEWTTEALERALEHGLQFVDSYYLALRDGGRFCWTVHVCAPYLNEPDAAWLDAGLPVVGYFHDRELALEGIDWMRRSLAGWQAAGAQRLIDFRELAGAVGRRLHLDTNANGLRLKIVSEGAPSLVRPIPIIIHVPGEQVPARIAVVHEGMDFSLDVHPLGDGFGRILLPVRERNDE
jgi:hypothetical protein